MEPPTLPLGVTCGQTRNKEIRVSGYNNNYGSDSDFEDNGPGSGGGGLRKMLEQVLEENKKLRESIEGKERSKTVTDLLREKELDPAIAQLIPTDADPAKWLEEKAHLFATGFERPKQEERDLSEVKVEAPSEEDIAVQLEQQRERDALDAMSNAQQSGTPAQVSNDLLEQLNKFQGSAEELEKFLAQNGAAGAF